MSLAITCCVVALLLVHHSASATHRPQPRERPSYHAKDHQLDELPDYSDPATAAELKCSACKVLSKELFLKLKELYALRRNQPKHFEVVEVVETLCAKLHNEYGLLMRNNKATTQFSKNDEISRMRGSWINTYIEGRCGHLLSSHEEEILELFPKARDLPEFRKGVCVKMDRSCQEDVAAAHDEL